MNDSERLLSTMKPQASSGSTQPPWNAGEREAVARSIPRYLRTGAAIASMPWKNL